MEVSEELWKERMNNLLNRRKVESIGNSKLPTYGELLSKCYIGNSLLDVGCGSMEIKKHIPATTEYMGIDAFPINNSVVEMKIEECVFEAKVFETVCAFAVLDGVNDLKMAVYQMKRICAKNIIILTGIGIKPDQYHTHEISEGDLEGMMYGFSATYKEYVSPKVLLIEYTRT